MLECIKKAMYNRGVTQAELARLTGMTQPQVNRFLKRKNTPSIDAVFRVTDALGIQIGVSIPAAI